MRAEPSRVGIGRRNGQQKKFILSLKPLTVTATTCCQINVYCHPNLFALTERTGRAKPGPRPCRQRWTQQTGWQMSPPSTASRRSTQVRQWRPTRPAVLMRRKGIPALATARGGAEAAGPGPSSRPRATCCCCQGPQKYDTYVEKCCSVAWRLQGGRVCPSHDMRGSELVRALANEREKVVVQGPCGSW